MCCWNLEFVFRGYRVVRFFERLLCLFKLFLDLGEFEIGYVRMEKVYILELERFVFEFY